jgi:transcriptional regulator with XRE-family HTH domain
MKEVFYPQMDEIISSSDLKNMMLSIGITMRKLRIQKGYKCAEYFAFEYQLNRSAYYGWENGKNISMKKLILVCEALDLSMLEFFQVVKLPARKRKNPVRNQGSALTSES